MSHVSRVLVNGLKGLSKEFTLSPLTFIHGPNRSNKTTIIDAIQLALLGYHPSLPKRPGDILDLASGEEMSVSLTFADGRGVTRSYLKAKKSASVSPADYAPDLRLMPCLDFSLYFGKTDTERVQQVMNLSQGLGADDRIPQILAGFKKIKVKDHQERDEKALLDLIAQMPVHKSGTPVQLWLSELLDWAKEKAKAETARAKQFESSRTVVTEANSIDAMSNVQTLDKLVQDIAEARRVEGEEMVKNDRRLQETKLYEQQHITRRRLETQITTAPRMVASAELQKEVDELFAQNKTLETEREATVVTGKGHSAISTAEASAITLLTRRADSFQKKIDEIDQLTCCPTCRASNDGWKIAVKTEYVTEVTKARQEIEARTKVMDDAKAAADALRPRFNGVKAAIEKNTARLQQLQKMIADSNDAEGKLRVWIVQLEEMGDKYKVEPAAPAPESTTLVTARARVTYLADQIRVLESQEAERKRITQIAEVALEARSTMEVSKLMVAHIRDQQSKLVEESFGPVLEVANKLVAGIIPSPIAYYEGRVGRYLPDGKFIPVQTFSGSEIKLTQVAITAGLARQAGDKIAIFDEMGVFDEDSRTKLIQNAIDVLEAGLIDQVIMLGVVPPPPSITPHATIIAC